MSVTTRIRSIVILAAAFLVAPTLLADFPASRIEPRMVFDGTIGQTVMFGGQTPVDRATSRVYELQETWFFNGSRWTRFYPAHSPSGRASHVFVWDSIRKRGILHGGEQTIRESNETRAVQLDDTWIWQNNDWRALAPAQSPGTRKLAGAAFDSARDRVVLYGGHRLSADRRRLDTLTDTWEFDGTTWTRVAENGPNLSKPILEYDPVRNETIMLGFTAEGATQMYRYNAASHAWTRFEHSSIPSCVNEATLTWNPDRHRITFIGGFCAGMVPGVTAEVQEWDGQTFTRLNHTTSPLRIFGHAAAYDTLRDGIVTYGGTNSAGSSNVTTYTWQGADWRFTFDGLTPAPRSLMASASDPDSGAIWMYSGVVDPGSGSTDLWRYQHGDWHQVIVDGTPDTCGSPLGVYDTDRKRFVITCANGAVYELDTVGLKWTKFDALKKVPPGRSFASIAYDPTIKRVVVYGGFNGVNQYLRDTWLWDGAQWTEVERNRAPGRSLAAMWYDPTLKKVVLYGGIGRPNSEARITRYNDMYSFDSSNGWTKLSPASTPGARYGAQVTVDPRTNKVLLFGGILYEEDAGGANGRQSYAGDMWEWNGTAWARRELSVAPSARENGLFQFDPSTNRLVMFGGYAGSFLSDTWLEDPTGLRWTIQPENTARRRSSRLR